MSEFFWNLRIYLQWAEKTALKHCYLHGSVTCPYVLGLANIWKRGSFFFEALFVSLRYRMHVCRRFVKSSFGAFLLWPCTSQGMRHFQTAIAIDEHTWWSLSFAFAGHTVWNVCLQDFPYIVNGTSPSSGTLNTNVITGLDMCSSSSTMHRSGQLLGILHVRFPIR